MWHPFRTLGKPNNREEPKEVTLKEKKEAIVHAVLNLPVFSWSIGASTYPDLIAQLKGRKVVIDGIYHQISIDGKSIGSRIDNPTFQEMLLGVRDFKSSELFDELYNEII